MEPNAVIGIAVLALALGVLVVLTFWSRRIIERIARRRLGSLRDFLRERR